MQALVKGVAGFELIKVNRSERHDKLPRLKTIIKRPTSTAIWDQHCKL